MKGLLTFIVCLGIAATACAQGIIKGKVLDSLRSSSVEYATVSIYHSEDGKLINGQLSDSTGSFTFSHVSPGNYYLKIDFIGYRTATINNIVVSRSQTTNLGDITIAPSVQYLEEVTVTGARDEVLNKMDRQIFRAEQFQSAKGGTALDVLKNTPSVTVNAEGEIRYRGSTGFQVLINGKPVVTDAATVLSLLPANGVKNVELLTAPSAKYDADGKAGIINIITEIGVDEGLTGVVNAQVGLPSLDNYDNVDNPQRYGADFSINYKKRKWDLSLGGSYLQNDIAGRRVGDVYTILGNHHTSFPSAGERSYQRRNYTTRAAVGFSPSKSNSFNVGFYYGNKSQSRRADIVYDNVKTDIETGEVISRANYFNGNIVKKEGDFSLGNFDYTHTFTNKSTLTLSALYEHALLRSNTTNLNTSLLDQADTSDYVLNTGDSPLNGFRIKADYVITIGQGKLESGYQYRWQSQTGSFLYLDAVLGTGTYKVNDEFSANIDIQNRIHGLYTQYSGSAGNLEYLAGLRYEYATRVFNADKLSTAYDLELSNLFPSANALYTFNKGWKLKAGFSSRVQRSTNNELNPYPEREHSETLEQGDPAIRPEFVYLSELGVIKEFESGTAFLTLYNQRIRNVVNRVNNVYNDTILNRIYTSAGNASQWGVEVSVNLNPVRWWTLYVGTNVYDYQIKGSLFNNTVDVNNSGIAYSLNTNQTFQITKTLSAQLTINYISERPTAIGEDSRFISPNASVKKSFLKGRLVALIQWQNIGMGIIPSNEQRITALGTDFYTTTNYIQEKDVLIVNVSFNFNKQNRKFKLPSSEFGEREF
ncbi:MAG: TonB-dependent receptor [Chryseolinea sp.]